MSLSNDELQRLEEYLDGVLTTVDADAVREYAATDPAWAAAIDALRADRSHRQKLFAALEPEPAEADRFATHLMNSVRGRRDRSRYGRIFRGSAAAAACLMVGMAGGWLLRDRSIAMNHVPPGTVVAGGHPAAKVAEVVAYQVELTDDAGRVTAVQKFDSLDKAREFADDLSRWQERQRQMRNGAAVVVADKF